MSIRKGVTTISASGYIDDAIAGKIILGQGWNGDVRRIVQGRKKQGDITAVLCKEKSEIWSDNWCIPETAPDPVAAHAWINWLLTPSTAVTEMEYHNYPIPIPAALSELPAELSKDDLFNVPTSYSDNYQYILNVSPQVVQERTEDLHASSRQADGGDLRPRTPSPSRRAAAAAFVQPALPGLADVAVAALLRDLLPRPARRSWWRSRWRRRPGSTRSATASTPASTTWCVDPLYLKIFYRTLLMAAGGSLLTILVGYPIAYWMARYLLDVQAAGAAADPGAVLDVVPDPHLRAEDHPRPPRLPGARTSASTSCSPSGRSAVGLVYNYLPLFIIPVFASLERMDWTLVEAATDLGAKPFNAFRQITLRLTAARRRHRGTAGVHPDVRGVHHPEHPQRR